MNPDVLDAFSAENPIRKLYDRSIRLAQEGQFDNVNKRMRFYGLHQLVHHAITKFPHLDLMECGCWLGHSTLILSSLMQEAGATGRLHVFDSFEGLSRFTESDLSEFWTTDAERARIQMHFKSDFDKMKALVSPFGFVDLHKGWIPEVFDGATVGTIGFASVDVDLHDPTRSSIEFLYPRLVPGGVMYFDDYAYKDFPGAKKAVDDHLRKNPPAFFLEGPAGSAFLIK